MSESFEWEFSDGNPAIVVHIPDGKGNYSFYALTHLAPESHYEREMVKALLRIAERTMSDSEPCVTNGADR